MPKNFVKELFIILNLMTFILFIIDKYKAKHHQWRISEFMLLECSVLGGALGGIAGMILCRHKIKKSYFRIGLPVILFIHIFLYFYWIDF
ncbi:DUF1294 domain-containing protein [Leptotrichia sp. OH3620_COT-345]|uniref:DUF1294 domain-containing protein n=1 Tax=Leptotrichia sp. OH3620_COT-345 TaxID=2491048 RepID=UPI000F6480FE|nr:DUF1294 domain-containing protein [Leptotrichia sp. OH3620_COT-345]RRD39769.1 DUF1294 domain-containing protein [Leptotrichia sp. OH3620_COT-345]